MRLFALGLLSILHLWVNAGELEESKPHCFEKHPIPTNSLSSPAEYKVLVNLAYSVGYSETFMDPLWSAYHIKWTANPHEAPRPSKFSIDTRTDAKLAHDDYTQKPSQGFDRGHMTPNHAIVSRYGAEAQKETFLMSNICPQKATMNQQTWRFLEHTIAHDFSTAYQDIWVVVGPIFDKMPKRLAGKSGVEKAAIPKAFFAIITGKNPDEEPQFIAIIMNQNEKGIQPLRKFLTTIDNIEKKTALDFFSGMTNEEEIESQEADGEAWELEQFLKP